MSFRSSTRRHLWCTTLLVSSAAIVLAGCDPASSSKPRTSSGTRTVRHQAVDRTGYLRPEAVGAAIAAPPWIAHLTPVDLDRDGRLDLIGCESQENRIFWLRQASPGRYEEVTVGTDLLAPVHVEAADMDADGDLDLLVSLMGYVFPNNDKIGSVVILENDGSQHFAPHVVLDHTSRVTDVRAGDFNEDGRMDLAVGQFGYDQGEIRWLEQTSPWQFKEHVLLELSGAINVLVADFNGDRRLDIVALISQQWEEIYFFENTGGAFRSKRIWGSTNEDYGSSGIYLTDLNNDTRPDILYTNGDGFGPAALPGPRPWHGVQWLENTGGGFFRYHRIGDLPGAYSPVSVDLDQDGHLDVVAVSAYSDWDKKNPRVVSMMWFRNDGRFNFEPQILAYAPKDLITLAVGDFDGDGSPVLATGGFYIFAPHINMGRITLWRR
ncbi:MAG: VCBS repeat-containing protein [Opitutaceae bacterium]|nr:VCBS repeat-containing protein [Opitutaceae bacterium]